MALVVTVATAAGAQKVLTFDELGLPADTIITDQYASRGVLFSPQDGVLRLISASEPLFPSEPMGLAEIPYWSSVIVADFTGDALSAGAWIDFGLVGDGVRSRHSTHQELPGRCWRQHRRRRRAFSGSTRQGSEACGSAMPGRAGPPTSSTTSHLSFRGPGPWLSSVCILLQRVAGGGRPGLQSRLSASPQFPASF